MAREKTTILDFETNGFQKTSVLSMTFKHTDSEESVSRYYYPREGEAYNESAIKVNGLTEEKITELRGDATYPRTFEEDKEFVIESFKDTKTLVGHNLEFDHSFLPQEVKDMNFDIVDTMKGNVELFEKYPKLSEAAEYFGVEVDKENLHGSAYDVKITEEVFNAMPEENKVPNEEYLTKMFSARDQETGEMIYPLGGTFDHKTSSEIAETMPDKFFDKFTEDKIDMYSDVLEKTKEVLEKTDNAELLDKMVDKAEGAFNEVIASNEHTSTETLDKLSSSEKESVREAVAENVNTSAETLDKLAEDKSEGVREAVADNEKTSEVTLDKLSRDESESVRENVASNENASEKTLDRLSEHNSEDIKIAVARNENTHESTLDRLSLEPSEDIKVAVAENVNTSEEALDRLAEDKSEYVRESVAENANTSDEALNKLAEDESKFVREAVAENNNTPEETLDKLAEDKSESVRFAVSENRSSSEETLDKLSYDESEKVRGGVAENTNTSEETLDRLSEDKSQSIREEVDNRLDRVVDSFTEKEFAEAIKEAKEEIKSSDKEMYSDNHGFDTFGHKAEKLDEFGFKVEDSLKETKNEARGFAKSALNKGAEKSFEERPENSKKMIKEHNNEHAISR